MLKKKKNHTASFFLVDEVENRFTRLRNRTRYKLPPIKKQSFFSAFRRSKVKQTPSEPSERKNKDFIDFL